MEQSFVNTKKCVDFIGGIIDIRINYQCVDSSQWILVFGIKVSAFFYKWISKRFSRVINKFINLTVHFSRISCDYK